eukprot:gene10739-17814_t
MGALVATYRQRAGGFTAIPSKKTLGGLSSCQTFADVESSFDEPRGWQSRVATGEWAERKKSVDENWQRTTKNLRSELEDNAPLIELLKLEGGLVIQKLIQQRADDSWKLHPCCLQDDGSFSNSMLDPLEPGNVEVVFLGNARGAVIVPRWNYRQCQSTVTVNPVHTNCFPATPCSPSMWFHRPVMDFYKQLALHNGVSQTAFVDALNLTEDSAFNKGFSRAAPAQECVGDDDDDEDEACVNLGEHTLFGAPLSDALLSDTPLGEHFKNDAPFSNAPRTKLTKGRFAPAAMAFLRTTHYLGR